MSWGLVANATNYQVNISKSPYGSANIVYTGNTSGSSITVSPALTAGLTYRWDVTASGLGGSALPSSNLYFQTQTTTPPTTYLFSTSAGTGGTVSAGGSYAANTSRTVTATPNSGYSFSSWSGSAVCSGQGSTCYFTMPAAAVSLMATFSIAALPDLVVSALTAPATGTAGGSIQISATVANQGTTSAGAYRLGFYFSTDAVITTSDTYSGTYCSMPALASTVSSGCSGLASVPASLASGTYYFGAIADDLGAVAESNEGNNTRAAANTIVIINPLAPVCTLTAMPARIPPGQSSTLTASCTPAANTFSWTGAGCAGKTTATCTVAPAVTTPYSVTGNNSYGSGSVSTVVTVKKPVDLTPILMLLLD
jgi:hypothetical protein